MVSTEMDDATDKGEDGAEGIVFAAGEPNDFTTDTIFLGSKGEGTKGTTLDVGNGGSGEV